MSNHCPKNNLRFILNKRYDQTLSLTWIGDTPDKISSLQPNNIKKYTTGTLNGISKLTNFYDDVEGQNQYQFVKTLFRYRSGDSWSNQMTKEEIEGLEIDYRLPFELEVKYYYAYDVNPSQYGLTNMFIKSLRFDGEYNLTIVDSEAVLDKDNPEMILQPKDIYKVFRLDGFEITKQDTGAGVDYEILYRFSQNGGRTYTPFEPLTQDNIKTLRLDELRFAEVQYLIKFNSDDGALVIYDIMLLGDFQNISANYLKTNRYGLKQDCLSQLLNNGASSDLLSTFGSGDQWTNSNESNAFPGDPENVLEYADGSNNGEPASNFIGLNINNIETAGLSCYVGNQMIQELEMNQNNGVGGMWGVGGNGEMTGAFGGIGLGEGGFWNPYQSDKIVAWQNLLANQMNSIFGWTVNYFITDPDENGIDRYMNEYQLKNVVKVSRLKIIVPENNFPDESLQLNYFNLDLFDTFEINIMKDEFKKTFGIEKRPSQDDIIHICITNKLYYIKHTQAIRDVMNASIHYKIILEKYENRADINIRDEESKDILNKLTNNTTLDELLLPEKRQEENKVANKEQTHSLAYDKIRQKIYSGVKIVQNPIYNDNIKIAKTYYDLSKREDEIAVDYYKVDKILKKGENRTFINWFSPKSSYDPTRRLSTETFTGYNLKQKSYTILDNYDDDTQIGYKIFFEPDHIFFQLNENTYDFPTEILTDIWYGLVINLNQRQHKLKFELYRRDMDIIVVMFNKDTQEKKELVTYNDLYNAFDPDDIDYTYENALLDGFLPVQNRETNFYVKESSQYNKLSAVTTLEIDIEPDEFDHDNDMKLIGSNIYFTNLRIFDDIIKPESKINVLNESIVRDEQHLIMFDNVNREIKARTYWNNRFE